VISKSDGKGKRVIKVTILDVNFDEDKGDYIGK